MRLDQNEYIVHTNSKHKKRYDFDYNERGRNTNESKQTHGANNGGQYYKYAAKAESYFRVDLAESRCQR